MKTHCPDLLQTHSNRRAVAVVEMVLCLPVLVFMILAAIHVNQIIQLKHKLTISAYEGVFAVSDPSSDRDAVNAKVATILDAAGIQDYKIQITPSDVGWDEIPMGTEIQITVDASIEANLKSNNVLNSSGRVSVNAVTYKGSL